jgi:hypothetical protein
MLVLMARSIPCSKVNGGSIPEHARAFSIE